MVDGNTDPERAVHVSGLCAYLMKEAAQKLQLQR